MQSTIDESLDWSDHYVQYGFVVRRGLLDRAYCDEALAEIRRVVDDDRPLTEWTGEKPGVHYKPFYDDPGRTGLTQKNEVLGRIYDQPGMRAAIDEMFGGPGVWDGLRNYYMFIKPYEPDAKPELDTVGHIDFGGKPVPILYRGFKFMASLVETERFSGNFSVFPASHKSALEVLVDDPDVTTPGEFPQMKRTNEPFEFVAEPGDVMFFHHLIFHAGNPSHSANRKPRVSLAGEAYRARWLTEIDPSEPDLSPWQRSLAVAGAYRVQRDEARREREDRDKYIKEIEQEQGTPVDEKWKRYSDWPDPPIV